MCQRNRKFHTSHIFETPPAHATRNGPQEDLGLHLESQSTKHCSCFYAFTTDVTVVLQCLDNQTILDAAEQVALSVSSRDCAEFS